MKKLILTFPLVCALVSGCAYFSTDQTDKSYVDDKGKPTREITTTAKATTFFAGKSELAKFKASQTDKTQSASVGNLNQATDGAEALGATIGATLKASGVLNK